MWLQKAFERNLVKLNANQKFMVYNCQYEAITGSVSYGVSGDASDMDLVSWCIPPKGVIFPHTLGHIIGFGQQPQKFETWQQHHVDDPDSDKTFDFSCYNIIKFFSLCMDNNPNMVDVLFVPLRCVTHSTEIGNLVRDNRRLFLHKGCWHKFRGYAFSQMHKMETKNPIGKRKEIVKKYGFDVKFSYHVVRLLDECEQILRDGDLDLERSREHLKAIRRGEVSPDEIRAYFARKEPELERLYNESDAIPMRPDEGKIKELLLNCLEQHYGSLDDVLQIPSREQSILDDLSKLLGKYT